MQSWTFYPAFIGTVISIIAWTNLAFKEHLSHLPRTLSELAAEKPAALRYYRVVLWTCGPLFAITLFAFIIERMQGKLIVGLAGGLVVMCEMAIGLFPAQRGKVTIHDIVAGIMGAAMIILGFAFAWQLHGNYRLVELIFSIIMGSLALSCLIDRKHYLFYELPLIYLSHFSILAAACALYM